MRKLLFRHRYAQKLTQWLPALTDMILEEIFLGAQPPDSIVMLAEHALSVLIKVASKGTVHHGAGHGVEVAEVTTVQVRQNGPERRAVGLENRLLHRKIPLFEVARIE